MTSASKTLGAGDQPTATMAVERFVWQAVPVSPISAPEPGALDGRTVLVLGDDQAEVAELREHLARFVATVAYSPSPVVDTVVDLGLGRGGASPDVAWEEAWTRTWDTMGLLVKDWATEDRCDRLVYCTVTRTGGHLGTQRSTPAAPTNPLSGLWAGFAKGLPREIPNCNVRVIDVDPILDTAGLAHRVAAELAALGGSSDALFEIGWPPGDPASRITLSPRPAPLVTGPTRRLTPDDVVLMSGGGRGIGFQFARRLASVFGCTVVVTGRTALAGPQDSRIMLQDSEFDQFQRDLLRRAARSGGVGRARRELVALRRARELHANLRAAAADGLDVQYRQCDVTDSQAVSGLLAGLRQELPAGRRVSVIIHDAGLDRPARLGRKSAAATIPVIRVKVTGFLNLLAAALADGQPADGQPAGGSGHELAVVCNVGSLTGRWGGMVGQLDYGAANEALARLGDWAGDRTAAVVTTVAWPTWERLGMVSNYEAATTYMTPVSVAEGLRHWERELVSGPGGEVSFLGQVGTALTPLLLRGYLSRWPVPGGARLRAAREALGVPEVYEPGRRLVTRGEPLPLTGAGWGEFQVGDGDALPISLLLNQLADLAEWVCPPGMGFLGMRRIWVQPAGLLPANPRERLVLRHDVRLLPRSTRYLGIQREVAWTVTRLDQSVVAQGIIVAADRAGLAHPARDPQETPDPHPPDPNRTAGPGSAALSLAWRDRLLRLAPGRTDARDILDPGTKRTFRFDPGEVERQLRQAYWVAGEPLTQLVGIADLYHDGRCTGIDYLSPDRHDGERPGLDQPVSHRSADQQREHPRVKETP